jgi:hypothetical protein
MRFTILILTITFGINVFAAPSAWNKQENLVVPVEKIAQVDTVTSEDGELSVKIVSIQNAGDSYDIAISFGDTQNYLSTGYSSVAGDFTLTKRADGVYQLGMLLGTLTEMPNGKDPVLGSVDVSLAVSVGENGAKLIQ